MSVSETSVVDAIGVEEATGVVVLTVSDHLEWGDTGAHLATLQAKLNRYLAFLESGEILVSYPASQGRETRIDVVFQSDPPHDARAFLANAAATIRQAGFTLSWRVHREAG